jgi:hypothetical protein
MRHVGCERVRLVGTSRSVKRRAYGGIRTRTVQPLKLVPLPLGYVRVESHRPGSNGRPAPYGDAALPLSYGGKAGTAAGLFP